jgi:hypothetical protein
MNLFPTLPSHILCKVTAATTLHSLRLSRALFTHTRSVYIYIYMTVLSRRPPLRPLKHHLQVCVNSNTKYSVPEVLIHFVRYLSFIVGEVFSVVVQKFIYLFIYLFICDAVNNDVSN